MAEAEPLTGRDVEEIVQNAIAPIQAALVPIQKLLLHVVDTTDQHTAKLREHDNALGSIQKLLLNVVDTTDQHTVTLREQTRHWQGLDGKVDKMDHRLERVETMLERDQKENRSNFLEIFTRLDHLEARL